MDSFNDTGPGRAIHFGCGKNDVFVPFWLQLPTTKEPWLIPFLFNDVMILAFLTPRRTASSWRHIRCANAQLSFPVLCDTLRHTHVVFLGIAPYNSFLSNQRRIDSSTYVLLNTQAAETWASLQVPPREQPSPHTSILEQLEIAVRYWYVLSYSSVL